VAGWDWRNGPADGARGGMAPKSVVTEGKPGAGPARRIDSTLGIPGQERVAGAAGPQADADMSLEALYRAHYRPLVGLAVLLVRDAGTAEEVVQDSFVAMHRMWCGLRDTDKALAYLRQSVVNRSRSVLRRRAVAARNAAALLPEVAAAEPAGNAFVERAAVMVALRSLPARQREVVVLRFYADMTEAQIAQAMHLSQGAVKSHASRAMAALRTMLAGER